MRCRRLPLLLLALLVLPSAVMAHRLDEYLQATLVAVEPGGVRLEMYLTPGVAVADEILAVVDRDRDGVISPNEAGAYGESLKRDLILKLDRRTVVLTLTASSFPEVAELRAGVGIIRLDFSTTAAPLTAGVHEITLENRHMPTSSVYLVNATLPKSRAVTVTKQKRSDDQSWAAIEFTFDPRSQADGRGSGAGIREKKTSPPGPRGGPSGGGTGA